MTAATLSPEKVHLLWNDPCPPNGIITQVRYRYTSMDHEYPLWITRWIYTVADDTMCTVSPDYDRCLEIDDLKPNTHYVYEVNT